MTKSAMIDNVFKRYSVAIVTPFKDSSTDPNQSIDMDGLKSVIDHVGSHIAEVRSEIDEIGGIIVTGSTGESSCLSDDEKIQVFKAAVQFASAHGVPVAAGVSCSRTLDAVNLCRTAVEVGCKGILLGFPPYLKLSDPEMRAYVMACKEAIPVETPVLLYNNEARNCYGPSNDLMVQLYREGVVCGVKLAVAPEMQFLHRASQMINEESSIRLYTGNDKLAGTLLATEAAARSLQFYGLTSILGNLFPGDVARMTLGIRLGMGTEVATALHTRLLPLVPRLLGECSLPVGVKHGMNVLGVNAGQCRLPLGPINPVQGVLIEEAIQTYKNTQVQILLKK